MSFAKFFELLWGTVYYRPYVYVFFACYLVFALKLLRWRGCLIYTGLAYALAWSCEYSSTRNGFPFGIYRYFDGMRARELWLSNIPFWDSLSFVFLSYFSWMLAIHLRSRGATREQLAVSLGRPATFLLSGLLMMLLDIVIDPLTLRGDRWFLGRIYDYPTGGSYFGVTIANFAGWFFVGALIPFVCNTVLRGLRIEPREPSSLDRKAFFGIYSGVFLFNLGITAAIGEWKLFFASAAVVALTLGASLKILYVQPHLTLRSHVD